MPLPKAAQSIPRVGRRSGRTGGAAFRGARALAAAALIAAAAPLAIAPLAGADGAPASALLAEFRRDPMRFFYEMRGTEAIQCGQVVLKESAPGSPEEAAARKKALTALAAIYLSTEKTSQARAACLEILATDPTADLEHAETLPPPVVRLFYGLRDSLLLASVRGATLDIRTLAVGDIENNSIVNGKYDLDRFARGLTQILITDLREVTPLRLVDRARLAVLRDEIRMSADDRATDPKFRVPLGQLTGAQSYLFGSIMQVDDKKIRLDLRWVNTSTGEVLLSEGVESRLGSADDLFRLEKKILLDLMVPEIESMLGKSGAKAGSVPKSDLKNMKKKAKPYLEAKRKALSGGESYVDLLLKTGDAVLAEERGDLAAAEAAWAEVGRLNPSDATAEGRAMALQAFRRLGGA